MATSSTTGKTPVRKSTESQKPAEKKATSSGTPAQAPDKPTVEAKENQNEAAESNQAKTSKKVKTEDKGFVYSTHLDPARDLPRTSLYLDDVVRENEEKVRAKIEGREPDLKNPPATQGTPLVRVDHLDIPNKPKADVTLPVVVE